jgi:DNA-directed RNA polymerase subunit alpha
MWSGEFMSTKLEYKPLTIPNLQWDKKTLSQDYGSLVMQPLEPGFGTTLGNALRRTLLGGVEGAAVTSVIISGVNNEFSVVPGVIEDTMHLVLNIKQLVVRSKDGRNGKMHLKLKGEGKALASDIVCDSNIEVVNKDHVIAATSPDADLDIEFFVECGRGYQSAKWPAGKSLQEDNRIYIDSMFSPVSRVFFDVEKTRVGDNIDYDRLILSIHTNGSENPVDVFNYAVSVLRSQLGCMLISDEIEFAPAVKNIDAVSQNSDNNIEIIEVDKSVLNRPIEELELSVRAQNCLSAAGIKRIAELVVMTEDEVANIKNFGRKSLKEVIESLDNIGLKLGVTIDDNSIDLE